LNYQHRIFAAAWVKNGCQNAKGAYMEAGYIGKGNSAEVAANTLLKKPDVKAEIERLLRPKMKRYNITTNKILQELYKIAFFDPQMLVNEDGSLKPLPEMNKAVAAAISSVQVKTLRDETGKVIGTDTKVKYWSKVEALTLLGRYKALFVDKITHDVNVKGGVMIIPSTLPSSEWEAAAIAHQQRLLGPPEDEVAEGEFEEVSEEEYEEEEE